MPWVIPGQTLVYVELDIREPELSYSTPENFQEQIEEGLLLWEKKQTIRFAEEYTVFLGIGHPGSRKFTDPSKPLPNLPVFELTESTAIIRDTYNQARLKSKPE